MLFSPALAFQAAWSTFSQSVFQPASRALEPQTIFEFSVPISAENLIERDNGNILITVQGGPQLFEINPHAEQSGGPIYTFPDHENTFGIAEVDQDIFYVLAANYTHAPSWTGIQGSNSLYRVDLTGNDVSVSKAFDINEAYTLDGLITINREKGLMLAGDTQTGTLYLFDTRTNEYTAVYQSELLNQTATHLDVQLDRVGVNGIKYYDGHLYYTDTSRYSFGRLPFDVETGRPVGEAEDLVHFKHHPDDFSISSSGIAVITVLEEGFVMLDLENPKRTTNRVTVLQDYYGANAALWGTNQRTKCTLYATYNLGVVSKDRSSGLIAMDTTGWKLTEGC